MAVDSRGEMFEGTLIDTEEYGRYGSGENFLRS